MKYAILAALLLTGPAFGDARQVDEFRWEGVERIVAVGDLHGDYEHYLATLQAAGLIDRKGKWIGGATHLVQTGDIPDRGPDTQKIIEHITKLDKQARRKGGRVHDLIGNHEAMNVTGDLRYVSEGEYQAFVTRNSPALRDRYFELYLQSLKTQYPEQFNALPADFRTQWDQEHPLGWVEHRQAWDPRFNPEGKYANWVLERKVAIQINDSLFVHGGISGFYCQNSLESMTDKVVDELKNFDPGTPGILEDEFGPLWYRGLAGVEPVAAPETVDAILAQHGIRHIVIGHTPTSGVIWPRYDGKVLMIDTGISRAYGSHVGYLEITPEGLFAGYATGKLPLPSSDDGVIAYLEKVIAMDPENPYLRQRLELLQHPPVAGDAQPAGPDAAGSEPDPAGEPQETAPPAAPVVPICGISS